MARAAPGGNRPGRLFSTKVSWRFDFGRRAVTERVCGEIRAGSSSLVSIQLEGGTWSRARRAMTPPLAVPLRDDSPQNIWGFGNFVRGHRKMLARANKELLAATSIMKACIAARTPCVLGAPCSSLLWSQHLAHLYELRSSSQLQLSRSDLCMFGLQSRSSLNFLAYRVKVPVAICKLRAGRCARTGKHRIRLTGATREGGWMTRSFTDYPHGFSRQLMMHNITT